MQKLTIIRRLGKIKIMVHQLINYFEMEETNEYEKYINQSYWFLSQPLMERKKYSLLFILRFYDIQYILFLMNFVNFLQKALHFKFSY